MIIFHLSTACNSQFELDSALKTVYVSIWLAATEKMIISNGWNIESSWNASTMSQQSSKLRWIHFNSEKKCGHNWNRRRSQCEFHAQFHSLGQLLSKLACNNKLRRNKIILIAPSMQFEFSVSVYSILRRIFFDRVTKVLCPKYTTVITKSWICTFFTWNALAHGELRPFCPFVSVSFQYLFSYSFLWSLFLVCIKASSLLSVKSAWDSCVEVQMSAVDLFHVEMVTNCESTLTLSHMKDI